MKKIWMAFGLIIIFNFSSFSQQITITGNVTDDKDAPLPNVKVVEKGTNNGVLTDFDGNYSITTNNSEELTLSYFFIGFDKQEIVVAGRTKIDVKMSTDSQILEEVVIVGYGSSRSKELTGAAAKVKGENIEKLNLSRMDQALQGQVSGVNISTNSGSPGGASSIRIRGLSTFGDNDPLILVDGVVYDSEGLNALNPADIESISILKDAASAAIYGARGGNGVVLITTKTGSKGQKPQITYESYYGIQEPWKYMALLNAEEYAILMNESRSAAGLAPLEALSNPAALGEGFDWQDEIFQRAPMMNHSFSFTKGTKTSSTAVGGSYFTQDGIIGGEKGRFERYTFRINTRQDGGERFRMGQNVNFTHLNRSALAENNEFATPVGRALNMDPTTPVTRPDGSYAYTNYIDSDIVNPINQIDQTYDNWTTNRFVGNVFGEVDVLPELKFRSSVNVDLSLGSQQIFFPTYDLALFPGDPNRPAAEVREVNSLIRAENKWSSWQWENTLTYSHEFENEDKIQVIAGYSALESRATSITASRDSLATNNAELAFLSNSLNVEPQIPRASDGITETAWIGQFVRATYDIGNQWSLMGTLRYDGSSRFGLNNRFGMFPSFSAAWNLTERPWFDEKDWIDFFKVRGSWGRNGNAEREGREKEGKS